MTEPTAIYLVVAYRWGESNNHQYFVYCGEDETKAVAMATAEVGDRGGKYDCAVYLTQEYGTAFKLHGYIAARDDATKPTHNWRLDMFETLGHICDRYADGQVSVLAADGKHLTHETVEPEPRLLSEVQRVRSMYRTLDKFEAERTAAALEKLQADAARAEVPPSDG